MAYSYSQLRRAVEAAEARETERENIARKQRIEASRSASGADGTLSAAASPARPHSEAAEVAQLRTQLTQQQAKMGELLQGLSAEWELERGRTVKVVYPLPHSGIPPPSLGGTVKGTVLVGPRPATTGSSDWFRKLEAALCTREERPSSQTPQGGRGLGARPRPRRRSRCV